MRPDNGPHFLIATEAEGVTGAESVELNGSDGFAADEQSLYGLGPEGLAQLQCLVQEREFDMNVLDLYEVVFVWDEMHGPWLIRLPDGFVSALAGFDTNRLDKLASGWAQVCYAFQANEAPFAWVKQIVSQLTALARRAVQHDKKVYWEVETC